MAIPDQDKLDIPDPTQAVNAIVTTFAAFVAISLADFFDEAKNQLGKDLRHWAFIAVLALLLRYIVGSAVHLNRAYGMRKGKGREGPPLPRFASSSRIWCFSWRSAASPVRSPIRSNSCISCSKRPGSSGSAWFGPSPTGVQAAVSAPSQGQRIA
jgi:hypothetical protein